MVLQDNFPDYFKHVQMYWKKLSNLYKNELTVEFICNNVNANDKFISYSSGIVSGYSWLDKKPLSFSKLNTKYMFFFSHSYSY